MEATFFNNNIKYEWVKLSIQNVEGVKLVENTRHNYRSHTFD